MMNYLYLILISIIFFTVNLFSQTIVSGNVTGTWLSSGNPYIVDDNVYVVDSLIIKPGVIVQFNAGGLKIEAGDGDKFIARGTEENPIKFESFVEHNKGAWDGIHLTSSGHDDTLEYCIIKDAYKGVYAYDTSPLINKCTIYNNSVHGIELKFVHNSQNPMVSNCTIYDNGDSGIRFMGYDRHGDISATGKIYKCTIYDNTENGIIVYSGTYWSSGSAYALVKITNCTIYQNKTGVRAYAYRGYADAEITNSIIAYNSEYGVVNQDSRSYIGSNDITYNCFYQNASGNFHEIDIPEGFGYNGDNKNWNGDACDINYNIYYDPLFVDRLNYDFNLEPASKCIDAGDPIIYGEYKLDPDGSKPEIGSHYFENTGPVLSVTPETLNFGQILVGTDATSNVTITNEGVDDLQIDNISLTGKDSGLYSTDTTTFTLAPDDSRDLSVQFAPISLGSFYATLEIESNGGDASVSLEGSGTYTIFTKIKDSPIYDDGGKSLASSWVDYDNNGDMDLLVTNKDGPNFLYNNNGDGIFSKIEKGAIVTDVENSQGCTWGDFNNDGYIDLFVSNSEEADNNLYRNNGNGTFTKITSGSVVNDGGGSIGCAWIDYNNDGYLDLFVANGSTGKNYLYKNKGSGTFSKITNGDIVNDNFYTVGCAWADFDNDGDLDLFTANWSEDGSRIYRNNGDGSFSVVIDSPVNQKTALGGSWGDYDNDGDLDLFITRLGNNALFRNEGNGDFFEVTNGPVVNDHGDSRGSCWADFDNDGDLDLFVANTANHDTVRNTNVLYFNQGDGTFVEETAGSIVTDSSASYSPSAADYDNDGDIDLFVSSLFDPYNNLLYENEGNDNNWINILCKGSQSNRSAIGAKVLLKATIFGKSYWQLREISSQTGGGQSSQNSLNAEFGLGDASIIDSIKVKWPSGRTNVLTNVGANQFLTINENNHPYVSNAIPDTSFDEDTGPHTIVEHLDSVFTDPDDDDLTYSSTTDNEHIASTIRIDTLWVEADSDYFGQGQIIVTAADEGGLSVNDTFMVEILPVDDPPFPFSLIAPADGDTLESLTQPLTFVWETSQEVDGDTLRYRLHVFDNGYDTTFTDIADTSYTINDPSFLSDNWTYQWTVLANDQHSVVSADTFSFVTPEAVDIAGFENGIPKQYELYQNFPNPFNPVTQIKFGLPKESKVKLEVYNSLGQKVATLLNSHKPAGYHEVTFDASKLASGVYIYRLTTNNGFSQTKKMILIR